MDKLHNENSPVRGNLHNTTSTSENAEWQAILMSTPADK